ncbi:MAG: RluA family pseudouridine synthase [Clostridia bacterium]|nr:RluA family pseudouridine synthase [Clostridia bacterium]
MRRDFSDRNEKRREQVRDEKRARLSATPVYTASYKASRSDFLLEFLLRKCNTSRNNVKSLLSRRQVLVNGSVVTQFDFPLAKDDEVKISKTPVQGQSLKNKPRERRQTKSVPPQEIRVIYEDENFLAIDKPAGLLSVESDKETECAYGYALAYLSGSTKQKNARPFILHRIDKETSGVLVFAKDIKIHSMLKLHWNELVSLREYYAVAEGTFETKTGTITTYLKENKNNLTYSTNDPSGQKAITHYEVIEENGEYSLLRVTIDTGRKNQIRVHLKDKGHAIVGDDKYGATKNPLSRLGLHASRLAFASPVTKEILTFNAPLPTCFRDLFGK